MATGYDPRRAVVPLVMLDAYVDTFSRGKHIEPVYQSHYPVLPLFSNIFI